MYVRTILALGPVELVLSKPIGELPACLASLLGLDEKLNCLFFGGSRAEREEHHCYLPGKLQNQGP